MGYRIKNIEPNFKNQQLVFTSRDIKSNRQDIDMISNGFERLYSDKRESYTADDLDSVGNLIRNENMIASKREQNRGFALITLITVFGVLFTGFVIFNIAGRLVR